MSRRPDFVIIGAMKCATTTLHDQLAQQPGFFLSTPKEPNFFSDESQFARGIDWYRGLFAAAPRDSLCGESSTHYTKLPTHPRCVERLAEHLPDARFIYVMRHPLQRLISHYVHEWTERTVPAPIDAAVRAAPRLVDYGCYAMQLRPYLDAFGPQRVLPVFFERLTLEPQAELERICRFLGYSGAPRWQVAQQASNVSAERLRTSPLRDALVWNPLSTWLRRRLVPHAAREWVKGWWRMKEKPRLSAGVRSEIEARFDADLVELSQWLGLSLTCANFAQIAARTPAAFHGLTAGAAR